MERRHDIDWLRVIAIGLLLVYHVAIGFQSWGVMIGFIASNKSWEPLWVPMTMLNVWRIPLLFFVSGMGVYFAMQRRNWKQLLLERASRLLIPLIFGMFCIFPISDYIWKHYYNWDYSYTPFPGHLWFLGNIFSYVLIFAPLFFYLKRNEDGVLSSFIKKAMSSPLAFLIVVAAFFLEVSTINPQPFELYAMTLHGFVLGLLCFFFGFCFVLSGRPFLDMLRRWKWIFLGLAAALFMFRVDQAQMRSPAILLVTESASWFFAVLAFGNRYLNHSGKVLRYLAGAAYPVYILHMIFLFLGSSLIFKLDLAPPVEFILVLVFTLIGCFGSYEIIRRIKYFRGFFGIVEKRSEGC